MAVGCFRSWTCGPEQGRVCLRYTFGSQLGLVVHTLVILDLGDLGGQSELHTEGSFPTPPLMILH